MNSCKKALPAVLCIMLTVQIQHSIIPPLFRSSPVDVSNTFNTIYDFFTSDKIGADFATFMAVPVSRNISINNVTCRNSNLSKETVCKTSV